MVAQIISLYRETVDRRDGIQHGVLKVVVRGEIAHLLHARFIAGVCQQVIKLWLG